MKLPEEKVAAALTKMTTMDEAALRRGVYRQHGEVIITPWSIDLGPARLMPVKRPLAEVKGLWLALDNPGQAVTVVDSKKEHAFPFLEHSGPPRAETIRARFAKLPYDSAETPLHHQVIRENCGMGHVDWPGHIFWFATADDRLVRYIYPSTHTSLGLDSPVNRTQVFTRPK